MKFLFHPNAHFPRVFMLGVFWGCISTLCISNILFWDPDTFFIQNGKHNRADKNSKELLVGQKMLPAAEEDLFCGSSQSQVAAALSSKERGSSIYFFHGKWLDFGLLKSKFQLLQEFNGNEAVCILIFLSPGFFPCQNIDGCLMPLWLRPGSFNIHLLPKTLEKKEFRFLNPSFEISSIVDSGASIGLSTYIFALAYPQAKIIAIEPLADDFELLQKNTKNLPNVVALRGGLWSHLAGLSISSEKTKPRNTLGLHETSLTFHSKSPDIGGISIPFILQTFQIPSIDFIKLSSEVEVERMSASRGKGKAYGGLDWIDMVKIVAIKAEDELLPGTNSLIKGSLHSDRYFKRTLGEYLLFLKFDLGDPTSFIEGEEFDD